MSKSKSLDGISHSPLVEQAVEVGHGGAAVVLGLGESSGRNSLYLAHNGYKVVAVDNHIGNLEMLAFAAHHAKLPVGVLAARIDDFKPESKYDLVVGHIYLPFFDRERLTETARMLQSITNPGGINALMVATDKADDGDRPRIYEKDILPSLYADWTVVSRTERPADESEDGMSQFDQMDFVATRLT